MPTESLVQRYRDQLQKLMPPGRALNRRLGSFLTEWLEAFSVEFARVHERTDDMVREAYPGDAVELLADWEALVGLPDECSHGATSDAQRQAGILTRFAVTEGQSLADFQAIATARGYANLAMGTYGTFRTGIHPIGHKPIYSDEWLFGSKVSYEVADPADTLADDALECKLVQHAHIHTQMNFNAWDAAPVNSTDLTNLLHHFVCGEYVTHDAAGKDIIDSWTNRAAGDDFVQTQTDAFTCYASLDEDGWLGCDCFDAGVARRLGGLYIGATHTNANMLAHRDYSLWVAFRLDSDYGGTQKAILNDGAGFSLRVDGANLEMLYDGVENVLTPVNVGGINVVAITHSGTVRRMSLNGGTVDADSTAGAATGTNELNIGQGLEGSIMEIVSCGYIGPLGTTAVVDDVTDYLIAKYR